MKKKIFGTIMAAVLTMSMTLNVFAAGSITNDVTSTDETIEIEQKAEESEHFQEILEKDPDAADIIEQVNKVTTESTGSTPEESKNAAKEIVNTGLEKALENAVASGNKQAQESIKNVITKLETKDMVTGFVNVKPKEDAKKNERGNYEVTMSVPSLTSLSIGVEILHYNSALGIWETLVPTSIDLVNKTVTFEFKEENAMIAVIAEEQEDSEGEGNGGNEGNEGSGNNGGSNDGNTASGSSDGEASPKTGVDSTWMQWTLAGMVLLCAGASLMAKKKENK